MNTPALKVTIKSIYRVLHKIKIVLTWKMRNLCCITLLLSQPIQRRWKDEPQGSSRALIGSLARYYLRCWGKPRNNCWTWSVTYRNFKTSRIKGENITPTRTCSCRHENIWHSSNSGLILTYLCADQYSGNSCSLPERCPRVCYPPHPGALRPNSGQSLLILEVSWLHTTTHHIR